MEPLTVSYLFLKVLPTLAKHAGQIALRELDTSVAKAARATAKEFPRYPDLASWLADWCARVKVDYCREANTINLLGVG
jgi:hypothetical protein